ncbi:hypothetical protein D9M70_599300 [compost metagenome]
MRVVHRVHRKRFGIVVDRDVYRPTERCLKTGRRAAAPGEVVDDELMRERQAPLAHHARPPTTRMHIVPTPMQPPISSPAMKKSSPLMR